MDPIISQWVLSDAVYFQFSAPVKEQKNGIDDADVNRSLDVYCEFNMTVIEG